MQHPPLPYPQPPSVLIYLNQTLQTVQYPPPHPFFFFFFFLLCRFVFFFFFSFRVKKTWWELTALCKFWGRPNLLKECCASYSIQEPIKSSALELDLNQELASEKPKGSLNNHLLLINCRYWRVTLSFGQRGELTRPPCVPSTCSHGHAQPSSLLIFAYSSVCLCILLLPRKLAHQGQNCSFRMTTVGYLAPMPILATWYYFFLFGFFFSVVLFY